MKRIALLLSLAVICALASCSKEEHNLYATIAGTVVSAIDNEPLAGATVTLNPSGKSYTTGSNGTFEFQNMDAQQYTVSAQKNGYISNRTTVTGVSGETVTISITLTPNENQ